MISKLHTLFDFLLAVAIQQASSLKQKLKTPSKVSKPWREPPQWSEQVRIVYFAVYFNNKRCYFVIRAGCESGDIAGKIHNQLKWGYVNCFLL